jgi:sterol 3beta-glucosyltransferase
LSVGWSGLEARENIETVHFLKNAPHDWLFPSCRAVVHHGGAGTTHGGLRHGRPSLICPYFGDQPFWGRNVAALGAGPKPLPIRSLTVDSLTRVLSEPKENRYAEAARGVAQCMSAENGMATAADLIGPVL